MPCVYCQWFSPDVATGEVTWLEKVKVGQKIEILVPVLGLQFILSPCTNDVFLPSFSMDEIALCDYFTPFGLF